MTDIRKPKKDEKTYRPPTCAFCRWRPVQKWELPNVASDDPMCGTCQREMSWGRAA